MTCTYNVSDLPERIASKIEVDANSCWLWTACKNARGYGSVGFEGSSRLAHRVIYELLVGKVPQGLELDHICRRHACTNPAHLQPVTHNENVLRGTGATARNAAKTHCVRGHELSTDNLVASDWIKRGIRRCLPCTKEQEAARYARHVEAKRAELAANGPPPPKPRRVKTHCIHGHALTPDNLVACYQNRRACLTCARNRAREFSRKQRAARRAQQQAVQQ